MEEAESPKVNRRPSKEIDPDDKYKRLKKKYSLMLQQHLKVHSEYKQSLEQMK